MTGRAISPADLGRSGEARATWFYRLRGYRVLARNLRETGAGEIDLVVSRWRTVAFVEVKARTRADRGQPWEAVDRAKSLRIAAAAQRFLSARKLTPAVVRFDVLSMLWDGRRFEVTPYLDAFRLETEPGRPWVWR